MEGKKTKGRRKIQMKRIENEDARLITFSKRRSGIYRKASEMTTLTGAEVAFLVFSPAGTPFSFGHPSVEAVVNRFLGQEQEPQDVADIILEASKQANIRKLTKYYNEMQTRMDVKKNEGKLIDQRTNGKGIKAWWDIPIEDLSLEELLQIEEYCNVMFMKIFDKIMERNSRASSSSYLPYVGSSSTHMHNSFTSTNAKEMAPPVFPPHFPEH